MKTIKITNVGGNRVLRFVDDLDAATQPGSSLFMSDCNPDLDVEHQRWTFGETKAGNINLETPGLSPHNSLATILHIANMEDVAPASASALVPAPQDDGLIDPASSERKIYREKVTGSQREIWRPGDGDGEQTTDYYERVGPPLPLEKRWRLFQTDIGCITQKNQPPRFVMLDDRATLEVLKSDIQRVKLVQNWPHDFGGQGKVRIRRPHRGRPAIKNPGAEADVKYHVTQVGGKKEDYFFSGEAGYQPINYRYEPPKPEEKRKKRKPTRDEEDYNPRGHGHNQYTPKDMMVKNGAPTFSLKERKATRVERFVSARASPPQATDRALSGSIAESAHFSVQHEALRRQQEINDVLSQQESEERRRLREQDADTDTAGTALGFGSTQDDDEDSDQEMPFRRPEPKRTKPDVAAMLAMPDASAYEPEIEVPRNMGFIEWRALEQKLAAQTIESIRTNEDVVKIANELSQANVKVQQQAQQIGTLSKTLEESQARVAELEAQNAEQQKELNDHYSFFQTLQPPE